MKASRATFLLLFAAALALALSAPLAAPAAAAKRGPPLAAGFGGDGRVTVPLALALADPQRRDNPAEAVALTTASNGGALTVLAALDHGGVAVLRFLPDGGLDPSFDGDGVVAGDTVPALAEAIPEMSGLALDSSGRPIVAINHDCGEPFYMGVPGVPPPPPVLIICPPTVLRLGNDGGLDPSFGNDGFAGRVLPHLVAPVRTAEDPEGLAMLDARPRLRRIAVDAADRIVLAGSAASFYAAGDDGALEPHRSPLLVRLDADGRVDGTFGADGAILVPELHDGDLDIDLAVAAGDRPSLLVCAANGGRGLLRFNADGSRDARFGASGLRELSTCPRALAIDARDRILILKPYCLKPHNTFCPAALHRWKPNGVSDTEFSGDGWLGPRRDDGRVAIWRDIVTAYDGGIYLAGAMGREAGEGWTEYALTAGRWDARGHRDRRFGRGGGAIVGFGDREIASGVTTTAALGDRQRLVVATALAPPPREGAVGGLALTAFRPFR